MRVLLDTNIIIHREASKVVNQDIGVLFNWLDRLQFIKYVHPLTAEELSRNTNTEMVSTMQLKLASYQPLKTEAPLHQIVKDVSSKIDTLPNDLNDTKLLNEVFCDRVDILISEDKKIHKKAAMLGISERVFRIETFLEKIIAENPELVNYKVLAVEKAYFGSIDLQDPFFDSFKEDYIGFEKWFNQKSNETVYVCYNNNVLSAFLYIKVEDDTETYGDITPMFERKKRLKIGTFKVTSNGLKLGERFLKIIFDNAIIAKVQEIYVTIFDKSQEQTRLIELLEDWGFNLHGIKSTSSGEEKVYVRDFNKDNVNSENPKLTFPRLSKTSNVFIVPIRPEYHTELLPDSILQNEAPNDFIANKAHRNALSKVYVSNSRERGLAPGDIIVFYRTGGYYKGVATTIGIVESIKQNIKDEEELITLCHKRTVLKEENLREFWNRYPNYKPFIVNFLYAFSLQKRPNLEKLIEFGAISSVDEVPRGFKKIEREHFEKIANYSFKK